jgi:guanylate kinase
LNDNPNWKYLEVKSFNGTYFHLSRSEKKEAIKRGKDFEIALVIDVQVHILKDYFNEDVDFDNNDLFYASPSDYIISLQLKKEQ